VNEEVVPGQLRLQSYSFGVWLRRSFWLTLAVYPGTGKTLHLRLENQGGAPLVQLVTTFNDPEFARLLAG